MASNTNKSMSTEEGDGFGAALVHFSASLAATKQESLPTVQHRMAAVPGCVLCPAILTGAAVWC